MKNKSILNTGNQEISKSTCQNRGRLLETNEWSRKYMHIEMFFFNSQKERSLLARAQYGRIEHQYSPAKGLWWRRATDMITGHVYSNHYNIQQTLLTLVGDWKRVN